MQLGVQDLHARGRLDVPRRHLRRALGPEVGRGWLVDLRIQDQTLQVEDDVGDVLGHLGDGRELVEHPIDLH